MTMIPAGRALDALTLTLDHGPLPTDQVVDGSPTTGFAELDAADGCVIGVWEHSAGTSTDVEADEVFIVLSGSGTLAFTSPALPAVELEPGTVVRLSEGMRTVWTVRETLRKLYIS